MNTSGWVFSPARSGAGKGFAVATVAVWTLLVLALMSRHVFWRDEVRALSLALQGEGVLAMLRGLQGEGHPVIWYLLLRAAHAVVASPVVLPAVSFLVALASACLLTRHSPFGWVLTAGVLLGQAGLYEYAVVARNYGIGMLAMFAFATLYRRYRDRGIVLGLLLLVLANSSAHAVLLAGAFALFWMLDLAWQRPPAPARAWRNFALNAALAALGAALCVATIYPPFNDAAQIARPEGGTAAAMAKALLLPSSSFGEVSGYRLFSDLLEPLSGEDQPRTLALYFLTSVLMVGSALGLVRRPAALVAAWVALFGFCVFFAFLYPGSYRHQALWLMFLVSLYWIVWREAAPSPGGSALRRRVGEVGAALFVAIVLLQVPGGLFKLAQLAQADAPESRSRDFGRLMARQPELRDATILADPDYLVEPLAYYVANRTYLMREQRFGKVVVFTRRARQSLTLDDILADAHRVRDSTGQPVVILLAERLDRSAPARTITEGYSWTLSTSPEQVERFLAATRRIERFAPACCSDESFDVYVLDR
ncbi:hypothetical protein LJR084_001045 [Variovorax sp. LjRoot84]|uniref:hypothetical protein n=1 Tax=Variovorax sp. LjRoot84 TaxID=3342340 RepID=UPI003ECE4243